MRLALAALAAAACGSARADDPGYELRLTGAFVIEPGASAALSVTIAPARGRSISADGPLRLEIAVAGDGVVVPRRRYLRKDAADPAADAPRFDVKLKARASGEHAVTIVARFWLCGARACRPIATRRTVTVSVPTPPIDAGPVDATPPIDAGIDAGRRRRR